MFTGYLLKAVIVKISHVSQNKNINKIIIPSRFKSLCIYYILRVN